MVSYEVARLAAFDGNRILDTEADQAVDDLALLASQISGTPIALITLLDEERPWFKSRLDRRDGNRAEYCFVLPSTR